MLVSSSMLSSLRELMILMEMVSPLFAVIREPTTPSPPADMALRVNPSGETSILTISRSALGPIAPIKGMIIRERTKGVKKCSERGILTLITEGEVVSDKASQQLVSYIGSLDLDEYA
jgi:hypothetical protein